jgi:UDP-N-acetylglucosamine diphosphorylase / glucose-1-phosphate thymidylyltransferase / UDP-N-acetylgalactosamine diphosphorylase / glucosamine-1-phosphate N-acetyltransferase / galactosamine-1-phosphate N-acetyltransferase
MHVQLPPIVLWDDGLESLSPLNDLRASFDVRTGALTLAERVGLVFGARPAGLIVPEVLAGITRERWTGVPVNQQLRVDDLPAEVLLINGRAGPLDRQAVVECVHHRGAMYDAADELVAGMVSKAVLLQLASETRSRRAASAPGPSALGGLMTAGRMMSRAVLTRPWHVRTLRDACITQDLDLLLQRSRSRPARTTSLDNVTIIGQQTLTVAQSAKLSPGVVLDVERGPIVIDEHAVIRPAVIIVGPAYIGPHSHALDRAFIKAYTAIGPYCKFAGEVGGTVVQGYSNKAHDGHLGDAWLGEWVNLGAGTTNSNLLNTYGEVIARRLGTAGEPSPSNERTGETFFGCVLGDHVKVAINTRIMTGAIVGMGTMFAATAALAGTVGPMQWITDGEQLKPTPKPYRFDKFLEVARAAMSRRSITPSDAYVEAMRSMAGG